MKVLFASKNNKAVDVVEARVNGLGNRPVLLRMGAKEYQAKLGSYLTAMLSGRVSPDDELNYQEGLERHKKLLERMEQLEEIQGRTLAARNLVDRLDAEAEDYRVLFGAQLFNGIKRDLLAAADEQLTRYRQAIDAVNPELRGFFGNMFGWLTKSSRIKALNRSEIALNPLAVHLGIEAGHQAKQVPIDIGALRAFLSQLTDRISAARKILEYQSALDVLRYSPSFEDIARQRQELTAQLASNSAGLWRDWVQMTPARLSPEDRRDIADYAAILQLINNQTSNNLDRNVWARSLSDFRDPSSRIGTPHPTPGTPPDELYPSRPRYPLPIAAVGG
jgi:tetratricopeptide (TPR) repeat protein